MQSFYNFRWQLLIIPLHFEILYFIYLGLGFVLTGIRNYLNISTLYTFYRKIHSIGRTL
jgi:hypothetical protein